jgi:hypothetical protein
MHPIADVNWRRRLLVPSVGLLELVIGGSPMYVMVFTAMRLFRRQAAALNTADLLVAVLVADAAQNVMASEYHSLTEGVLELSPSPPAGVRESLAISHHETNT